MKSIVFSLNSNSDSDSDSNSDSDSDSDKDSGYEADDEKEISGNNNDNDKDDDSNDDENNDEDNNDDSDNSDNDSNEDYDSDSGGENSDEDNNSDEENSIEFQKNLLEKYIRRNEKVKDALKKNEELNLDNPKRLEALGNISDDDFSGQKFKDAADFNDKNDTKNALVEEREYLNEKILEAKGELNRLGVPLDSKSIDNNFSFSLGFIIS